MRIAGHHCAAVCQIKTGRPREVMIPRFVQLAAVISGVFLAANCESTTPSAIGPSVQSGSILVVADAPALPIPKGTRVELFGSVLRQIRDMPANGRLVFDSIAPGAYY